MTEQNLTPEEQALKTKIDDLAQQLEPNADFVADLEQQLVKSELLASTETAKQSKPARPRFSFPWLWVGFGAGAVALLLVIWGNGWFFGPSDQPAEIAAITPTLSAGYPVTSTATPILALPTTPTPNVESSPAEATVETNQGANSAVPPPTASPLPPRPVYSALSSQPEKLLRAGDSLARGYYYKAEEAQKLAGIISGDTEGRSSSASASTQPQSTFPAPTATPAPSVPQATLTPIPPADMFFAEYGVNPFLDTEDERFSTFAMDVDTASYTIARNYITQVGQLPPPEAIRSEEFVNYFDADYEGPIDEDEAFAIHLAAAPAPFGRENHYLFRVGLQGRFIPAEARDPAFLIFVIDVSGSMDTGNRLGLVKESLALLVDELTERDRVAIVVYSDNSRVVLDPTPASERRSILNAIEALRPEGSTNVDAGLRLGYQLAESYQRENENTRVIVLSDGVANVDVVTPEGILANIQRGVERGVTLSTIGFGMENYNDVLMEQLANDGNGNYYYVDTLRQARRIFVHDLTSTLQVIGYDAKVQVDFNPQVTDRFRQIGYENRGLANEDFRNDSVDAGEVGAGHNITALYEIALENRDLAPADVIATVYIRYQDADTREVVELHRDLTVGELQRSIEAAPFTFRLQAAAAEFAELLKGSYWAQDGSYDDLLNFVIELERERPNHLQVVELVELIELARGY